MVNRKRNYTLYLLLFSALLLVALGAFNYLGMEYRARLDLTADRRFTLSEGTRAILKKLPGTVNLTYYVSSEPPPARVNLERDVRDKLEELATASEGKLSYSVERIEQKDIATRMEDLGKSGIELSQDVQTTGDERDRALIGVSGYLSSILVRYGPATPKAINKIVNVVSPDDERRENRVETLEFDIMSAVLKMKSEQSKPPLKQLLRNLKEPLQITYWVSEQMPRNYPEVGANVTKALDRLKDYGGSKVRSETIVVAFGEPQFVRTADGRTSVLPYNETQEPTIDPKDAPKETTPGTPPGTPPGERDGDETADSPEKSQGTPPGGGVDPNKHPGGVTPPGGASQPTQPDKPAPRQGPKRYYTFVNLVYGDRAVYVYDFSEDRTVDAIVNKLEQKLWEILKPRTTLGILSSDPTGADPRSPYSQLTQYILSLRGFEGREINLKQEKRVPSDLAVLVVFEGQNLSERELYEVDRYLAEGGTVVMLYQAYSAEMRVMNLSTPDIPLRPLPQRPWFVEWCKHYGISFDPDMLVQRGGYNMQAVQGFGQRAIKAEIGLPLAAKIEPQDTDQGSIYARGLSGLPLPFPVELKLDDKRLEEMKLSRQDVIKLAGSIYRYLPENRNSPVISRRLTLAEDAEREDNPDAKAAEGIRLQRVKSPPLICSALSGTFQSYWGGKDKLVPRWEGAPADKTDLGGQPPPEFKARPGRLIVASCAATFNANYFDSWRNEDINPILGGGVNFYRNMAEAGIYGDELVSLRAKTGAAPRITGDVKRSDRIAWYVICLAGAPALLMILGFMRQAYRAKAREEYRLTLESAEKD